MKHKCYYVIAASVAAFLLLNPSTALAKPVVGTPTYPSNIEAGTPATISASVSSGVSIQSCNLYVDNVDKGSMSVSGGTASVDYTFPYSQVYTVFVFCKDTGGGMGKSDSIGLWVKTGPPPPEGEPFGGGEEEPEPEPVDEPAPEEESTAEPGDLIKLICQEGAETNDPCKAVYYYGTDEKRHAFPNAKVFFTWYEDFDSIKEISSEAMSGIPLGVNVTYRPGVKMVKFRTMNRVYAVAKGGVLRWVTTEEVAIALYGEDWNTKIDDIADTFFMNYTFGDDIETAEDYSVQAEMDGAPAVDDSLAIAPEQPCQTSCEA